MRNLRSAPSPPRRVPAPSPALPPAAGPASDPGADVAPLGPFVASAPAPTAVPPDAGDVEPAIPPVRPRIRLSRSR